MSPTTRLRWRLADVAAVTGGRVVGDADIAVGAVTIDSRTVAPGDLFVALEGSRTDGHRFAGAAIDAGAAAVLVAEGRSVAATPRVEVDDPVRALRDLAAARRRSIEAPALAITGSTGKTSTKQLLTAAIPGAWGSPRSYNNEIGVPLTVLATPDTATALVIEVGSRGAGHIRCLLPAIRPDVAVVTNLGVVHLETFGTEAALADAKWELVDGLRTGGVAVLPAGEPRLARKHRGETITFGSGPDADVRYGEIVLDDRARPAFRLDAGGPSRRVRLAMAGAHNAANAAAAAAAALAVGMDLDTIVAGLEAATPQPWRMEITQGRFTVVNDAYNANPTSTEAALRAVAAMPGRHVAILGEMAELGHVRDREHRRIGSLAARLGFDALVTVGPVHGMAEAAGAIARPVDGLEAAAEVALELAGPGTVILVKASRAVGLERVADRLVAEARA